MKRYFTLLLLIFAFGPSMAQPPGWSGFQAYTVTNNSSTLVLGYQMPIIANTQALISTSQMQATGADIRFGPTCNSATFFPHYIDSGINTANTRIFVKIDTLFPSASRTIYLFYGNPTAVTSSTLTIFNGPFSSTNQVFGGAAGGVALCQRGFRFSPNVDILVTQFGKNEPTGTTRYVTLFDFTTQAILRQGQVSGPLGVYSYANISQPIWLTATTQYTVQLFSGAGDGYYFGTSSQINANLTYLDMRYCNSCTQNTFPTTTLTNYHYGYPDFNFYTRNVVTPAPTVVAGGTGGVAFSPQPSSVTICPGANASFTAGVTGTVTSYQWQVLVGATWTNLTNTAPYSNVTTSTLNITSAPATLNGNQYRLQVVTTCGASNSNAATLTVGVGSPTVTIAVAPGTNVCTGTLLNFTSSGITNAGPTPTYQWRLNGNPIAGATSPTYSSSTLANGSVISLQLTSSYTCATPNPVISNSITMTISAGPPIAVGNNGPICAGQTLNLTASSFTGATYSWTGPNSYTSNVQNPVITNAQTTATGSYTVSVTAPGCPFAPSTTNAVVNPIPTATATPAGPTNICERDSVNIQANTGTGLTYQWKLNGNNIGGQTASNYYATNTGTYTVVVTNSFNCSVTSAPVAVSVNAAPTSVVTYSSPLEFCEGGAVVLNTYTSSGLTYQWQLNGNPISGATATSTTAYQGGSYTVKVINAFGCFGVSPPVNVQVHALPTPTIAVNGNVLSTANNYIDYQWYFNNQLIPSATSSSYNYASTGYGGYRVYVTDSNGCKAPSPAMYISVTGVNSQFVAGNVRIYPNPVTDIVHIEAPVKVNVIIRDPQGRQVMQQNDASSMDLQPLSAGIYLMYISDKQGNLITTEKITKTR